MASEFQPYWATGENKAANANVTVKKTSRRAGWNGNWGQYCGFGCVKFEIPNRHSKETKEEAV